MKTYILRDPQPVELQNPLRSEPGIVALTDAIVGPKTPDRYGKRGGCWLSRCSFKKGKLGSQDNGTK